MAHSQQLLASVDGVSITRADARDPAAVPSAPTVTELLDFTEPVAVLAVALMHFVSDDDDPAGMIAGYRRVLVPGNFLAISQAATTTTTPTSPRTSGRWSSSTAAAPHRPSSATAHKFARSSAVSTWSSQASSTSTTGTTMSRTLRSSATPPDLPASRELGRANFLHERSIAITGTIAPSALEINGVLAAPTAVSLLLRAMRLNATFVGVRPAE